MKLVMRLNEENLKYLVKETLKCMLQEDNEPLEDAPKAKRRREAICHTSRAFTPGDRITYWRSVSGKPSAKFVATVKDFDGTTLTIDENGNEKKLASNSPNIISNTAWVKPLRLFMNGSYELPDFYYRVDYEKGEDGNLMVTITDTVRQKKHWYRHDDGTPVKVENSNRSYVSQWKAKPGTPFPLKVNSETAQGFVDIDKDWFLLDKMGKFYAWKIEKRSKIAEACPWLRDMDARWKGNNWPKALTGNPYKK